MSGAEKSVECIRGIQGAARVIGLLGTGTGNWLLEWRRDARFCKAAYNPLIAPKVQLSTMKDAAHTPSENGGRKGERWGSGSGSGHAEAKSDDGTGCLGYSCRVNGCAALRCCRPRCVTRWSTSAIP